MLKNVNTGQLSLRWMKTPHRKKKRGYFFCYEGVVEDKNLRKSVKSQHVGLEVFSSKGTIQRV